MNTTSDESAGVQTAVVAQPASSTLALDAPIPAGERIALIDVLRGFALFGILLVNVEFFRLPGQAILFDLRLYDLPLDRLADGAVQILAEGKFFTLFSFLFGYGMALQMRRASDPGVGFRRRFVTRCAWLALFGLLHATLVWDGDILFTYGVLGLVLLLVRFQPTWLLGYWSGLAFALAMCASGFGALIIYGLEDLGLGGMIRGYEPRQDEVHLLGQAADTILLYAHGPWLAVTTHRTAEWLGTMLPITVFMMWPNVLATFLLGLIASRHRFLERPEQHRGVHRVLWAVGLLIGIPGTILLWQFYYVEPRPILSVWAVALSPVLAPAQTALYVVILITVWRWAWMRDRLSILAPVGRMVLTNYLTQSLVCGVIFYSHGWGLIGGVTPMAGLALVGAIFLTQILISHAWLSVFRFGPMEWLWRGLTYRSWQPMWRELQPSLARV